MNMALHELNVHNPNVLTACHAMMIELLAGEPVLKDKICVAGKGVAVDTTAEAKDVELLIEASAHTRWTVNW
jgi:hypothetical protein